MQAQQIIVQTASDPVWRWVIAAVLVPIAVAVSGALAGRAARRRQRR